MTENQKSELPKSVFGAIDKYGETLWKGIKYLFKEASKEARVSWKAGYQRYLESAAKRYYFAKSFLHANEPQPLYDFYVPLSLSNRFTELNRAAINEVTELRRFNVIVASGGSGKTMMMRHLFMDVIETTGQVPVFVELRELFRSASTANAHLSIYFSKR